MRCRLTKACLWTLTISFSIVAFGQKVKIGYDKRADFQKFKTYSWAEPMAPPTRPMLYTIVVDTIDYELPDAMATAPWADLGRKITVHVRPNGPARFIIEYGAPNGVTWFDTP